MLGQRIETYWAGRAESYNAHVQKEMVCQKKQAWESLLQKYAGAQENHCGFQQVEVQENISELVHDEIEQLLYTTTPMFAICASK